MKPQIARRQGRHYVAAMVLGTALSTLATPAPALATAPISENAVNSLSRYCTACWRNAGLPSDRWGDCTQQVLERLLERVEPPSWGRLLARDSAERRELVRAIDTIKKKTQRELKRARPLAGPVPDLRSVRQQERAETRAAVGQAATRLLSARQQRILQLSFDGGSVQEIAGALDLPPDRISDEKYKAISKLRAYFQGL